MNLPKVSVVICTYNQEGFVRETLDSVLAQTYPNREIIVTDDGSTDGTPQILKQYAAAHSDCLGVVLSDRNTGIPQNWNRGLQRVTGDLLVCMDGDDLMVPGKLAAQASFLAEHPEATGCYHDTEVFESETGLVLGPMSVLYNGTTELRQGALGEWLRPRNFFLPSAIMFRAEARPPEGFDERLKYLSEVVFYAQVFRTGTLLAVNGQYARYRRHDRNITGDPAARGQSLEHELLAYAILEGRYPELHPILRRLRVSGLLAEALRAHRLGLPARRDALIADAFSQGGRMQAISVHVATRLLGRRSGELTGGSTFSRPEWLTRLARWVLGR